MCQKRPVYPKKRPVYNKEECQLVDQARLPTNTQKEPGYIRKRLKNTPKKKRSTRQYTSDLFTARLHPNTTIYLLVFGWNLQYICCILESTIYLLYIGIYNISVIYWNLQYICCTQTLTDILYTSKREPIKEKNYELTNTKDYQRTIKGTCIHPKENPKVNLSHTDQPNLTCSLSYLHIGRQQKITNKP